MSIRKKPCPWCDGGGCSQCDDGWIVVSYLDDETGEETFEDDDEDAE